MVTGTGTGTGEKDEADEYEESSAPLVTGEGVADDRVRSGAVTLGDEKELGGREAPRPISSASSTGCPTGGSVAGGVDDVVGGGG